MAAESRRKVFDRTAPLTVGQAEGIILAVLRAYGASVVAHTPALARPHVARVVAAVREDLKEIVRRVLEDSA